MTSGYTQSTVVIYKDSFKALTKLKSKNKIKPGLPGKYANINISDEDDDEDDNNIDHSKRSNIFSRTRTTKLSTQSKSSKKSHEKSKTKSHRSMKSFTKSISRRSHRERKDNDNISKSSKSFSVKTFYRNRRSRNRNRNRNISYHNNNNNNNNQYSLNSNISILKTAQTSKSQSSHINIDRSLRSGNWRCEHCNYFPNTGFDPYCNKCGAIKDDVNVELQNKSQKRTFSATGTISSSPILAPGSLAAHSSNINQNNIIIQSSDNTTTDDDNNDTNDSNSNSNSDSNTSIPDGQAIIVEDYRSKTSKSTNSFSRNAIGQLMDIDDNIDTDVGMVMALPQKHKKSVIENKDDESFDDDDSYSDSSNDNDHVLATDVCDTHLIKGRRMSLSINNIIPTFNWNNNNNKKYLSPKMEEWNSFQWYLGFKRFILSILYFILTVEEAFILINIKWWLALPLLLCIIYLLLIIYIGKFNNIKYNNCRRTLCLILFYFINVLIIIGPPMNVLIASANVYDFNDILKRNMIYNNLMWIFFSIAIISMIFIDIVIVHNGHKTNKNDKYRVETFKLAVVKDEEYVLNNQCLWYNVPRKDWGTIHEKKHKIDEKNVNEGVSKQKQKQKKDTKSFFVRIGLQKQDNNYNPRIFVGQNEHADDEESSDVSSTDADDDINGVNMIGNTNMENRFDISSVDNEFDDGRRRQSHSITNIINNDRDNKIRRRCCAKPFSCLQWMLISIFFISLQICVMFAILDTNEIQKHDISLPPPKQ